MGIKSSKAFDEAYAKLNTEQRAAVDTIEGPVMVVAGPGTGKTQTIALRIANILLKTDTDPGAILALTFTESAAKEMRERLARFIGHTAYYIHVSTFHSFCVEVIRDNPDSFTIDPSAEPLSDLDKLKLLQDILDQGSWRDIRPIGAPYHYVKDIIASISHLKREGVDPDSFGRVLEQESDFLEKEGGELKKTEFAKRKKSLGKNIELLEAYRLYEQNLLTSKRYDFEDMISHTTRAFGNNPDLLADYQERFHYFLIDEYQDTNNAQNKVVELLASFHGESANVMVCGDPDQAIMRFQGASIENQLSFIHNYPHATVITLKENYRSGQAILDSAHALIRHNALRIENVVPGIDPQLHAAKVREPGLVQLTTTASSLSEDIFIAEKINELIAKGVPPTEIVVIYHNNADGPALGQTLAKFGIDYVVQGGGNVLQEPVVERLLKIFRVINEMRTKKDDQNLFTILHYDIFGIDPLDVLKISRRASESRLTLFDIISNDEVLLELGLTTHKEIKTVLDSLAKWQDIDANNTFTQFFETVLNESGYLNFVLGGLDVANNISRLNALFSEVKKMNLADHQLNLASFLHNLDLMQQNNLRIEALGLGSRHSAITLTTAHSAKGLEWEHVFVYKLYDGQWGNRRKNELFQLPTQLLKNVDLSKKEKNEDERRLFYVAVTRAKTNLYLTRANSYSVYGRSREVVPSMFLYELAGVKETELSPKKEEEIALNLQKILQTNEAQDTSQAEKAFLQELVDDFKLSVTALNNYLECPYHFKLKSLVRVPQAKQPHLAFGTAVHHSLEAMYKFLKDSGLRPEFNIVYQEFAQALQKEVLTLTDESHWLREGKKILQAYYDFFRDELAQPLFLEKKENVVLPVGQEGVDIPLTGKIDRIDWEDKAAHTVKVIDYKTGSLKTTGQIMGTTQDSNGSLHRQLVFYKLLIDLDRRLNVTLGSAELDFVEAPADKGKSGKKSFAITDAEVQELTQTIHRVMGEIRALNFPRIKDMSICKDCEFFDHCYPSGIV